MDTKTNRENLENMLDNGKRSQQLHLRAIIWKIYSHGEVTQARNSDPETYAEHLTARHLTARPLRQAYLLEAHPFVEGTAASYSDPDFGAK